MVSIIFAFKRAVIFGSLNIGVIQMSSNNPHDPKVICSILPQLDCNKCGFSTCMEFAVSLIEGKSDVEDCSALMNPRFTQQMLKLQEIFG